MASFKYQYICVYNMNEKGKKIITFIISLIVIVSFVNVLFRYVLPTKPVMLRSNSMSPTYHKYDVLIYSKSADYSVNDVILFKTSRTPIVARIVSINEDGTYKTKGDNNPVSIQTPALDETQVSRDLIIGKIVFTSNPYLFYNISYGIQILFAFLLTALVSSKKTRQ